MSITPQSSNIQKSTVALWLESSERIILTLTEIDVFTEQ